MRFNGTTVPTNRDDTYTTKETNRDIQTGRAVYADKDKYENDEAYKANIDKYVAEGFHLIFGTPDQPSEGGSGESGGGGAEPLIVNVISDVSLDKTWQEIHDAFPNVYIKKISGSPFGDAVYMQSIEKIYNRPNPQGVMSYGLVLDDGTEVYTTYATNSADGYPTAVIG